MKKNIISSDKNELLYLIIKAKHDMDNAMKNINFVSDPLLIDHYTYSYKAAEIHYEYLMEEAKKMGVLRKLYAEQMFEDRYYK